MAKYLVLDQNIFQQINNCGPFTKIKQQGYKKTNKAKTRNTRFHCIFDTNKTALGAIYSVLRWRNCKLISKSCFNDLSLTTFNVWHFCKIEKRQAKRILHYGVEIITWYLFSCSTSKQSLQMFIYAFISSFLVSSLANLENFLWPRPMGYRPDNTGLYQPLEKASKPSFGIKQIH